MNAIFVRSPFFISINETDQLLTKVELYIYKANESEPATPTITLQKQIPDTVNRSCLFNISPYIKDYIELSNTGYAVVADEDFNIWRKVTVKRYWKEDPADVWNELADLEYIAVNGYTSYSIGSQQAIVANVLYLRNPSVRIKGNSLNNYFNALVDFDNTSGDNLILRYRTLSDVLVEDVTVFDEEDASGVYLLKIPYRTSDPDMADGGSVQILYDTTSETEQRFKLTFVNQEECLYTPVVCTFVNSYGGWQFLTFFKQRTDTYDITSKEFKLLANNPADYNKQRGQSQSFNHELTQTVKLNTDWVDENTIELLVELLTSETILLDNVPVKLATKNISKKTRLKDGLINYEMDFIYNFNLINDVD